MIKDIPAAQYHADEVDAPSPTLSCSIAKILLNQTPAHARLAHPRLNPDYEGGDEATRLDIGTACHALLLEGIDSVAVCEFADWRTKAAQEARDVARLEGKIPLLAKQYETVQKMAGIAKKAAFDAGFDLSIGKPEQTVIWQEGDVWCRARPDWLANDHRLILDYKTTELPSPKAWMRAMAGLGYDVQDEFYRRGVHSATLGNKLCALPDFVFMVQQTFEPYLCFFVELSNTMREIADIKVERALAIWRTCLAADVWPGWTQSIHEAEATPWQLAEAETMASESEPTRLDDRITLQAIGGVSKEAFLCGSVQDDKKVKAVTLEEFDK